MLKEHAAALRELAAALGFASPASFIAGFMTAYRRDPALVARTLAALGVRPEKKPAPPTTPTAPPSP